MISAQTDNVIHASAAATAYVMPALIYCGVVVNLNTLPVWQAWL